MATDLERLRDHARQMADEPTTTDNEAHLWLQIADEIDEYLNTTPETEPGLF